MRKFFLTIGLISLLAGAILYFSSQEVLFAAPQIFISAPATTSRAVDFSFTVGTTTSLSAFGTTTLAIYGSTTIQTPINTRYAFNVINAASSTIFQIDTVNASTTVAGQLNAQTLTVTSCTGCGGLTGGSLNALTYWTSTTAISATSSPTIGWLTATTTGSIFTGGFVSQASSTFSSGAFRVEGAVTFPGGLTLTCISCITDANVTDVLTVGSTGSVNSLALIDGGTIGFEWVDAEVAAVLTISGGTVNNSAIGVTTPSTGAFTTLSSTGLYSMFGNLTATSTITLQSGGVLDLSAATTFKVPVSASSTITATGELELDTNKLAIHANFAGTTYGILATSTFGFTIGSTTASTDVALGKRMTNNFRVTRVDAMLAMLDSYTTATTVGMVFNLQHGTNKGNRATVFTNDQGTSRVTGSGTGTFTSLTSGFNDVTVASGEQWWFTTSAASSSLHDAVINIEGFYEP